LRGGVQDCQRSLPKCRDDELRPSSQDLVVTVIDENGAAASSMRAVNIPPTIANKKTALQVDVMGGSSTLQHAGLWFSAIAWIAMTDPAVKTDFDPIETRQGHSQQRMHGLDQFAALRSAPYVRLIGNHN
jgi:hypothetical protein